MSAPLRSAALDAGRPGTHNWLVASLLPPQPHRAGRGGCGPSLGSAHCHPRTMSSHQRACNRGWPVNLTNSLLFAMELLKGSALQRSPVSTVVLAAEIENKNLNRPKKKKSDWAAVAKQHKLVSIDGYEWEVLKGLNPNKTSGPDCVTGRLLKQCLVQPPGTLCNFSVVCSWSGHGTFGTLRADSNHQLVNS